MEPTATVIVIHGYQGKADDFWKPWLRKELDIRGIATKFPQMPTPNIPKEEEWLDVLDQLVTTAAKPIVLVGHSLGGLTVLRWLETRAKEPIHGAVLVAGVTDPTNYDFKDNFQKPSDWTRISTSTKHLVGIYSKDDTAVPFEQSQVLKEHGATLLDVDGYGHFSSKKNVTKIPELLQVIDTLIHLAK